MCSTWPDFFDRAERFVVLTEAANGSVADVHSRMPVILEPGEVRPWLADAAFARAVIRRPGPILTRVAAEA
jgi:putative SOS response-associated peptidase YedK